MCTTLIVEAPYVTEASVKGGRRSGRSGIRLLQRVSHFGEVHGFDDDAGAERRIGPQEWREADLRAQAVDARAELGDVNGLDEAAPNRERIVGERVYAALRERQQENVTSIGAAGLHVGIDRGSQRFPQFDVKMAR